MGHGQVCRNTAIVGQFGVGYEGFATTGFLGVLAEVVAAGQRDVQPIEPDVFQGLSGLASDEEIALSLDGEVSQLYVFDTADGTAGGAAVDVYEDRVFVGPT